MTGAFYFMVWVLNLTDLQLTHEIIRLGGAEANPIMKPLFGFGWIHPLVAKIFACVAIGLIIKYVHPRDRELVAAVAMITSMLPVTWNVWVLLRLIQMGQ